MSATVSHRKSRKSRRVVFGPLYVVLEQHEDNCDQIISADNRPEHVTLIAAEMNRVTRSKRFVTREIDTESVRFFEVFRSGKGGAA